MPRERVARVTKFVVAAALVLSIGASVANAQTGPTQVRLGTASSFAILAGTPNITDAGNTSVISGNVGLRPGPGSGIGLLCSQVTGTIYARDATGDPCFTVNDPLLLTAKNDLTTAYNDAAGRTPVTTIPTELGGRTLTPGVYRSASTTFGITSGAGPLILDAQGDPFGVFIFLMNSGATGLTVGPDSEVQLTGQAQSCNVFWKLNTATIDTTATFKGTILALTQITVANGANIEGRLLARTANVTLINDNITRTGCAPRPSAGPPPPIGGVGTGGGSTAGIQDVGLFMIGGALLAGALGAFALRRRATRKGSPS